MKLFSNFDTNIRKKTVNISVQQYGEGNVLCFEKSLLYWFLKIFLPLIQFTLLDVSLIRFFYYIFDYQYLVPIILIFLLVTSPFYIYLVGRYIDYKMDFVIVTPDSLIEYNQTGLFNKKVVTINEKSIKTITVERKGLLYSIFNNGNLIFLSEGDETRGDITFFYVYNPEELRNQAAIIMHKD
jgi:uncharacterized membrane protein YdbT with pleckstrin-like domain